MVEEIKILLGDASGNFSDAQINLAYRLAVNEVETYCNRDVKTDAALELICEQIAVIKLLRTNTEGLASQSMGGVSEAYMDGYPAEIIAVLNRKRKIKVL